MSESITSYDPNIDWAVHTIEFTFMQWDYSLTLQSEVYGNCKGFDILRDGISRIFDGLLDAADDGCVLIVLRKASTNEELEIYLEDDDELSDLCTSANIVGHREIQRSQAKVGGNGS